MEVVKKLKYAKVKIEKPIVLHDQDIIDLQDLVDEINLIKSIGGVFSDSVYIYHLGFDYATDIKHFHYFNADNLLKYIYKYTAINPKRKVKINLTNTGMEFIEPKCIKGKYY